MYTEAVLLRALRLHWRGTVLVAVAATYSFVAAGTTPFTWAANGVTAGAFAAMALVLARHLVRLRPAHKIELREAVPIVVLLLLIVAFELTTYFLNDRAAFPTLSSLYDETSRTRAVEAFVFFAWLVLGWTLFA